MTSKSFGNLELSYIPLVCSDTYEKIYVRPSGFGPAGRGSQEASVEQLIPPTFPDKVLPIALTF